MNSILRDIFNDEYDTTPTWNKKQQELNKQISAEWDKVQKMLGDEFIDRLFSLEAEQEHRRAFHYFREGFRLGVRLMLEALGA